MLLGGVVLIPPAVADAPMRVLPSRDVRAAYQVSGAAAGIPGLAPAGEGAAVLRLAWDASGQRLRVQADDRPEVAIVDLSARRADIVDAALHTALVLPMRARDVAALTLSQAQATRQGRGAVLGYACTIWAVRAARGSGTVCVTEDGVALRGTGDVDGRHGEFVALSIAYAPQPASLFTIPSGYTRLDLRQFGRTD